RERFRQKARRPQLVELNEELAGAVALEEPTTAEDIREAVEQLSLNQRSALVMRELEGRPYREIASVLGLSVSAVETLLFRARRALREQLENSLSCEEAERSLSRQSDAQLPRVERAALRAHLRACPDCERLARSRRASAGWRGVMALPFPSSL